MTIRFVLLSTQRSGSTWVIDMLNSHPKIAAYSELFLENAQDKPAWGGAKDVMFWATYMTKKRTGLDKCDTCDLLFQYMDELYAPRKDLRTIGFKLMYGQAGAYPDLYDYIVSKNIYVAHLIRKNLLDILISKEVAAISDVYHVKDGEEVKKDKIYLDTHKLIDRLIRQEREVQKARNKFSDSVFQYSEVFYEDLKSSQAGFNVLLKFLQVKPSAKELFSPLRKINTAPHKDIIENYEMVKQTLEGTRFSTMLR